MNYKRIIFFGVTEPFTHDRSLQYFNRVYKNAQQDNYTLNEFFDGCINAINLLEEEIYNSFPAWQKDKSNLLKDWEKNVTYNEDHRKKVIKELQDELKCDEDTYKKLFVFPLNDTEGLAVGISRFTKVSDKKPPKRKVYLSKTDLNIMKKSIEEISDNLEPKKQKNKPTDIEPLEFNLNQTDIVHFFDLLVDADIIKEPSNEVHKTTKGGFYGKLSNYFTAKGKTINARSAKATKTNKNNKLTPYSDSYYLMLNNLRKTIAKKLRD